MCVHVITRNSGFWSTGGQLPVGALLARDIRGAVLQRDAGPAVPVEERMGGNEQEADGRQVRRQGGRRGRQDGRDQSAAAGRHRSHAVAGAAHLQLGYDLRRRFPPRRTVEPVGIGSGSSPVSVGRDFFLDVTAFRSKRNLRDDF